MAILHMPERVVAVTKRPRREKIRVVAVLLLPQRVMVFFFWLIERFRTLSVTYTNKHMRGTLVE
jgi:hypothetical protein